ncbi:MAG TPA: hypothetical protein VJ868_05890 [Actinomycetota bacterium]|nr:hypothetical protein [Actinomycetota bacterium]
MRRAALALAVVLAAGCADDRVDLGYTLEPGRRLEYRLLLEARVVRTLEGETREQSVRATFLAGQEIVEPLPGGGARALFSLRPESLAVDGRPVEPGQPQEFEVDLGPDGRVVAIARPAEAGAPGEDAPEAVAALGIERLLPRLRPVLPGEPVRAGERWTSSTRFTDEDGEFSLALESRLERLGVEDGYRAAMVRTTYVSPVDRRETFVNAVADVEGTDEGVQEAWFSLDGFLIRSIGDSVGRYRVTFRPPGGEAGLAPVGGALTVNLHTELELVSAAGRER